MTAEFVVRRPLAEFALWEKMSAGRAVFSFDLEATARCNLDCRHCYINVPAGDRAAKKRELSVDEIGRIGAEAAARGAVWCLITGGEPLLRKDFFDLYQALLSKGLLLSLFTNATLVTDEHIRFFKKFPPRDIEVTVYGVTRETYERVTRTPGSFAAFERGLDRLLGSGVTIRLKAMALRSNKHEIAAIGDFCRAQDQGLLPLRPAAPSPLRPGRGPEHDDPGRKAQPEGGRPAGADRPGALRRLDGRPAATSSRPRPRPGRVSRRCRHIFRCGVGRRSFVIGPEGLLRPCLSLHHPDFLFDLRKGSLADAWARFLPEALSRESDRPEYAEKCGKCPVVNLCLWCPAHAYLETGELDLPVEDFCRVAEARAEGLKSG